MKLSWKWPLVALCLSVPLTAQAHRAWMLPSATVISGDDVWITVDAAVSNDLFYFEHFPLRIANLGGPEPELPGRRGGGGAILTIFAPDGTTVPHQNGATGRYRSTFDVPIKQKGTYKFAVTNSSVFASYKENGQTRRWSGAPADFAKSVPAGATDVRSTFNQSRMEVFVTSGKPTTGTLKTTGPRTGARHSSQRPGGRRRIDLPASARRQARAKREGIDRAGRQPLSRQAR
jgi:hypothetical protein